MIKLINLTKHYIIGTQSVSVLNNINLEITTGEFVAIMGPSGSGKSTLMNILGLLDNFTFGTYLFNQQDVSSYDHNQRAKLRNYEIGFIFQSFMLLEQYNVLENVSLPLVYQKMPAEEIKEKSYQIVKEVGLEKWHHHKPKELSGGQQQRVAIARALVTKPKIILADEPTGALDTKTGQEIFDLLIHFNKVELTTVIIVTHDERIARQCSKIIYLRDGEIL